MTSPSASPAHVARSQAILALVTVLLALAFGYGAYTQSRAETVRTMLRWTVATASQLDGAIQLGDGDAKTTLLEQWDRVSASNPEVFACMMDADGTVVLHTTHPERIGKSAADMRGLEEHAPTVRELLASRGDWSGEAVTLAGEAQLVTFHYSPVANALIGVHVPESLVQSTVWRESLPWLTGLALLTLVVILLQAFAFRMQAEKHAATEALRRKSEEWQHFSLATNDLLWSWDFDHGHVERTLRFSTGMGYDEDEISGDISWWVERVHPDDRDRVLGIFAQARDTGGNACSYRYRFRRKDGSYADILDNVYILRDATGKPTRALGAMQDISRQQELERQVQQAQKMEVVGQLAGGVAHDFNNLLMVMALAVDFEEDLAKRTIRSAIGQARAVTSKLLAFSRPTPTEQVPVDLVPTVRELERTLLPLLGDDIQLRLELEPTEAWTQVDAGAMEQVLLNLAVNARDAMPDGGELCVTLRSAGSSWEVTVQDRGSGIPPESLSDIFEPFFTTKGSGSGTGLGLSVVRRLVQDWGGEVTVASTPGEGSSFTVTLPRYVGEVRRADAADDHAPQPVTAGARILVVEDTELLRSSMVRALVHAGHDVQAAASGDDAIELAARFQPDLVLSDVVMPGMNAPTLIRGLRDAGIEAPVLLMTGHQEQFDESDVQSIGAVGLLRKPFEMHVLASMVHDLLADADDVPHDRQTG